MTEPHRLIMKLFI